MDIINPQINIQYSPLLEFYFKSDASPTEDQILAQTKLFKDAWANIEHTLTDIQEITGLHFSQSYIDVFIVGQLHHPISSPVLIGSTKTPDEFPDVLMHELIHCLLVHNTCDTLFWQARTALFPNETKLCGVHIFVHAILKEFYLEILHEPARLARDIEWCQKRSSDYARAWQIVEEIGSKKIIADLRARLG